ncbi:MAG: superoxide dismutase family protein [Pseudomonadota bacterium]|nr:superoxide dismutase family protein [Pseudomonadota bacterium]
MPQFLSRPALIATAAFALAACGGGKEEARPLLGELAPAGGADAAGTLINAAGETVGHVVFTNGTGGVLMRVDIKGLSQGWHGIHLHQKGDCSDGPEGFKASGGHIDPDEHEHGLLNANGSERADLPNIYAGPDGRATAEIFRWGVSLYPTEAGAAENGPYPLLDDDGFAVIVHENPDDQTTQPIGGAAGRVACAALNG